MTAGEAIQGALMNAVRSALSGVAVFDGPPVRAGRPHVVVEHPVLTDWGTKDMSGREGRVAVLVHGAGERPGRTATLAAAAERAALMCPATLPGGWQIVSMTFWRSRVAREGDGRWLAATEFRVRMLRMH